MKNTTFPITKIAQFWDWLESRDIDKYVLLIVILYGTTIVMRWSISYANLHSAGSDTALVLAVNASYIALQVAALNFIRSR